MSEELFARLVADQAASDQPGARTARDLGLLTVFGTLGRFYLLTRSGEVLVDEDDDAVRHADAVEREFGHVQAARRFPQLRDLAPERPALARTCDRCGGEGELRVNDRDLCCPGCNTRGWTV